VAIHHVRVIGRVQGVGFRQFVRERARALGLSGWVKNQPDGSVELLVAGDDQAAARLLDIIRRGPPYADVAAIEPIGASGEAPSIPTSQLPHPFAVVHE
jgi:acylphosphatase